MVSLLLLDRMLREQQYDQSLSPLFAKQFFHELKTRTRGMWYVNKCYYLSWLALIDVATGFLRNTRVRLASRYDCSFL